MAASVEKPSGSGHHQAQGARSTGRRTVPFHPYDPVHQVQVRRPGAEDIDQDFGK